METPGLVYGDPEMPVNKIAVLTMLTTISRVYPGNELIDEAEDMKLNLVAGNTHAQEIYENGIPLAYALQRRLPGAEVLMFHDRVTSTPLNKFGGEKIREYGKTMADEHLSKGL